MDSLHPIVVLGMPRSGTSLASQLLVAWGAYGGEAHEWQPADNKNPRGYLEWIPLQAFHRDLFDSIAVSPLHGDFEAQLVQRSGDPEWRAAVQRLVQRMNRGERPWFWKFPQYALALPFWTRTVPGARYLICVRDPRSVCSSMRSMFVPPDLVPLITVDKVLLLLWQHQLSEILRYTDGKPRLFLSFERLQAAPEEECARLLRFLNAAVEPPLRTSSPFSLGQLVERSPSVVQPISDEHLTVRQKGLWAVLQGKLENDVGSLDLRDYQLDADERELLNAVFILRQYHYRVAETRSLPRSLVLVWENLRCRLSGKRGPR